MCLPRTVIFVQSQFKTEIDIVLIPLKPKYCMIKMQAYFLFYCTTLGPHLWILLAIRATKQKC